MRHGSLFIKTAISAALLLSLSAGAFAIEITLAENKSKTGLVGFVDLELIFNSNEDTKAAKSEFDGELKVKENEILQRRNEVYALKGQLQKLGEERAYLSQLAPKTAEKELPKAKQNAAEATPIAVAPIMVSSAAVSSATIASIAAQHENPNQGPVIIRAAAVNLSTGAVNLSTPSVNVQGGVILSTAAAEKQSSVVTLAELNARILTLETELASKENELRQFLVLAESELVDYENRRMRVILGRIYYVLREIASQEGISVVIDKRSILYGEKAVDLTPKLLERMAQMQY